MKYLLEMSRFSERNKITSIELDFYLHSPKYKPVRFTQPEINNLKIILGAYEFEHYLDKFDNEHEEKLIFSKTDELTNFTFFKVEPEGKDIMYLVSYRNLMTSTHHKFEDWFNLEVFTRKMKSLES